MANTKSHELRLELLRRLRLEYNLDRVSDCIAAIKLALAGGAGHEVLAALRFRLDRARRLPALRAEAQALARGGFRTLRAVTTRKLSTAELPEAFALASISAAALAKGSANDQRRNARKAVVVAAYLEEGERAGNQTLLGQELLLRAAREADR